MTQLDDADRVRPVTGGPRGDRSRAHVHPSTPADVPTIRAADGRLLEVTGRLVVGRIHEHLKALRVKLVRGGLAERGARLTPAVMVDLLLACGAITRSHLRLLDDEAWLRAQEAQWWDA